MNDKREAIVDEDPRYRKKAKRKGMPRADHKHEYKTVLLCRYYNNPLRPGERTAVTSATEVCEICGRIGYVDHDQYELVDLEGSYPYPMKKRQIRNEDKLEKWICEDYFDKFARKMTDIDIQEFVNAKVSNLN